MPSDDGKDARRREDEAAIQRQRHLTKDEIVAVRERNRARLRIKSLLNNLTETLGVHGRALRYSDVEVHTLINALWAIRDDPKMALEQPEKGEA